MELLRLKFSRSSIRTLFALFERPDFTWKIVVSFTMISAVVIGTLGVLSYNWSITAELPEEIVSTKTTKITATEIRSVIELYKAKQKRFQVLQHERPTPPALGGGAGPTTEVSLPLPEATVSTPAVAQ